MEFDRLDAPFIAPLANVATIMRQVLIALVPAVLAHVWFFGPGLIFNIIVAAAFCAGGEAAMMYLRGREIRHALSDYSAMITAVLLAFALPPLTPWWVTASASLFGIVVAKHMYGGLGFNVFNPAMAGYVVVLVAFPVHMNFWIAPRMGDLDYQALSFFQSLGFTLTGALPDGLTFDSITRATPLDTVKSGLNTMHTFDEIHSNPMMGDFGGRGWEWVSNFVAIGGFWLLAKKVIRWHIPFAVLAGLLLPSGLMYFLQAGVHPSPGFYLFSGGAMICAFFVATDPVSAATSVKGRLVYGFGIGILIYCMRRWGNYADGVAFSVLLMNMAVPVIDYVTRPRIVGHLRHEKEQSR
jgi:electron transport complex protein RnfD